MTQAFGKLKLSVQYFDSVCRVCLSPAKVLVPIEQVNLTHCLNAKGLIETIGLEEVFSKFCGVMVLNTDKKPQGICEHCLNAAQTSFNFFQLFLCSNEYLDNKLNIDTIITNITTRHPLQITTDTPINDSNESPITPKNIPDQLTSITGKKICYDLSNTPLIELLEKMKHCLDGSADMIIPGVEIFSCRFCKKKIDGMENVIKHAEKEHHNAINCILCSRVLHKRSEEYRMYHLVSHSEKGTVCRICRLYFQTQELLDRHNSWLDHVNSMCTLCGKTFPIGRNFILYSKKHMQEMHIRERKFICKLCGRVFFRKQAHDRHHKTIHLKQKNYVCPHCSKDFTTNNAMKMHLQKQHGVDQGINMIRAKESFICYICEKAFMSKTVLKKHIMQHGETLRSRLKNGTEPVNGAVAEEPVGASNVSDDK